VPDDVALSANERAELERLRAEVADWRVQVSTAPAPSEQPVVVLATRRPHINDLTGRL
jgi:hypothetical protein